MNYEWVSLEIFPVEKCIGKWEKSVAVLLKDMLVWFLIVEAAIFRKHTRISVLIVYLDIQLNFNNVKIFNRLNFILGIYYMGSFGDFWSYGMLEILLDIGSYTVFLAFQSEKSLSIQKLLWVFRIIFNLYICILSLFFLSIRTIMWISHVLREI